MKNSTLATRLAMAAVFLAVIIYFGFSAASYFTDPYTATLAYSFVGERAVTVSGYVVRDEEVLPGGGELVYSNRREGERVSAGGTVAQIYQSAQALQDANILRSLQEQAEQLDYAAALAAGSRTSVRLDDEITSALIGVRQSMSAGGLTAAADQSAALRTAVLKRSYAYSGSGGLDASAAALRERISALAASADPGTARIAAPRAGLFSSLVDGYESVLTRENILALTPSSYRAITPEAGAAGVGRLVYGTGWSFVTMMRTEDVGRMQPGDNLTLRFQKGLDRDMAVEVASVSAEEDGRRVVVLTSDKYLHLTTLLRLQNAQIIFESYDGIRVPRSAVRVNAQIIFESYDGIRVPRSAVRVNAQPLTDEDGEALLDSNGNPITRNLTCVYCLWGEKARSKPVTILWQEEEYILVAPDEEALGKYAAEQTKESRRLRAGDEVITAAADLYDGKVIR